ncbi:hypothetical protein BKA70DRAFT_1428237 [Coprinopsis sp. MPI-PUGE-AT-0042]|nr:hypothetical protein BKA70DRAFT_1428237 [Coprinopsis sp. MPI-PUGE-AT-0042]
MTTSLPTLWVHSRSSSIWGTPERACYAYRCPSTGDFTIAFHVSLNVAHDQPTPNDFFLPRPLEKAASASLPPPRYRPSNVSLANPWPQPHHPRTRRMDQRCWSIHPQWAINFCAKQESSFRNKPDIGQTKKSKGITRIMRAFLGIREKADSPLSPNILTPVAQGSYVGRRRTRWW